MYGNSGIKIESMHLWKSFCIQEIYQVHSRQRDTDGIKRTSTMVVLIKTLILITIRFKLEMMIFKIYSQM